MAQPALAEAAPLLVVDGVSKQFPGVIALDDVALDVRAGEILGLMGENGAGKSTLLKILSGAQPPTSGRITFDGAGKRITPERSEPHFSEFRLLAGV